MKKINTVFSASFVIKKINRAKIRGTADFPRFSCIMSPSWKLYHIFSSIYLFSVEPLNSGHFWAKARWPLFRGGRYWEVWLYIDSYVGTEGQWPLSGGGRYWEGAAIRGSTVPLFGCEMRMFALRWHLTSPSDRSTTKQTHFVCKTFFYSERIGIYHSVL